MSKLKRLFKKIEKLNYSLLIIILIVLKVAIIFPELPKISPVVNIGIQIITNK